MIDDDQKESIKKSENIPPTVTLRLGTKSHPNERQKVLASIDHTAADAPKKCGSVVTTHPIV